MPCEDRHRGRQKAAQRSLTQTFPPPSVTGCEGLCETTHQAATLYMTCYIDLWMASA